ncbi:hypothetical protein F383_35233 [Gossypium arboreum]|uniref:Factor of DNA methylation 1-5/IDN2 domain-containing protein n=1 Tax=Gossypium arboreum TaxID=29729 RepID=A0A0B0N642_GOSAR|nr:hypothetical protein F383_35233 [Gossypium arboreum]
MLKETKDLASLRVVSSSSSLLYLLGNRTNIGLKRTGELDPKAFNDTCKLRFPTDEVEIQATTLCSSWQENLKNPDWHPIFRRN